jgi:metal-responsive CopG/Arc/MetJ family transcriptional regulator
MNTISLPIPEELLEAIDRARGDVPRTVWIRRAIEQRLKKEQK